MTLGLLSVEGRDVVLAGALISIVINPLLFSLLDRLHVTDHAAQLADRTVEKNHVILVGYGRVGQLVGVALQRAGRPLVVIENDPKIVARLHADGLPAILGQASAPGVLELANIAHARLLVNAIPNVFEAGMPLPGHAN
ncbi:MAG TPA: NAD-binding protein [Nitrospira sp.]|nr:NAD-binding protein [Nitrospira sp.]